MTKKWWLSALAVVVVFMGSLATTMALADSTLDAIKQRGELLAGVRYDMPPYGYVGEDGSVTGLDIVIVNYLAQKLGVKVKLVQVTAQSRIPMLQNGTVDVLAAGVAHTPEREKAVAFSATYFEAGTQFLVKSDSQATGYRDFSGKTVATIQGTPYMEQLLKKEPSVKALTLQEYPQAVLAVSNGKADGLIAENDILSGLIKQDQGLKIVGNISDFPAWHIALGVRQNDSQWRDFLNSTLAEMWQKGILQKTVADMGLHYEPGFNIEASQP